MSSQTGRTKAITILQSCKVLNKDFFEINNNLSLDVRNKDGEQSNTKIDHAKDCKILQPREENKKK